MDVTDIVEYLTNPSNYPVFLIFLSGYVITSSLAGKSWRWKSMNQMEKLIVSALVGLALDVGIIISPYLLVSFWLGSFSLDFNYLLQQTSIWFIYFGGIIPLSLHIYGYPDTKMLEKLRDIFRLLYFFLLSELIISVVIFFQILAYPAYIQSYVAPIWAFFSLVSLVSFIICSITYLLTNFLFITPLLRERSIRTTNVSRRKDLIRKVTKLSLRNRLLLLKPSKLIRITVLIGAIFIIASLLIVPIDQTNPFLTLRLQQGEKSPYIDPSLSRIVLLGVQPRFENLTYELYQMVYVPYNISVPPFNLVKKILLDSPSNISENSETKLPTSLNSWADIKNMWASPIEGLEFEFVKLNKTLTIDEVWVDWSNLTSNNLISFNITYYERVDRSIMVKTSNYIEESENQTTEVYCYIIENQESVDLEIPMIEMHRLLFDDVNLNLTRIIRNGQEAPYVSVSIGHVYPDCLVPHHSTVNFTILIDVMKQ